MLEFAQKNKKIRLSIVFLTVFLPLALLAGAIFMSFYLNTIKTQQHITAVTEQSTVDLQARYLMDDFNAVFSDLTIMSKNLFLIQYSDGDFNKIAQLEIEFLRFLKQKHVYDQVCFLDKTGKEKIKINFIAGQPYSVENSKSKEINQNVFFHDAFKKQQGQIYISPFEFNTAQGITGKSLQPILYFATPVIDFYNQKQGVIFYKYYGINMLRRFNEISSTNKASPILISSDGSWLEAERNGDKLNFIYPNQKKLHFTKRYAEEWSYIQKHHRGQIQTDNGLFTFTTLYPLQRKYAADNQPGDISKPSLDQGDNQAYFWIIVSFIDSNKQTAGQQQILKKQSIFYLAALMILAFAAGLFSLAHIRRSNANNELLLAKTMIETSPVVFFRWEPENKGRVTFVTENIKQFGYHADDLISDKLSMSDIIYPDDLNNFLHTIKKHSDNNTPSFTQEYRIYSANNTIHWIENRTSIQRDSQGNLSHYQGLILDITERRQMEGQLQKLAKVVEQCQESIIITNVNTEIEYVNEAFTQSSGYSLAEVVGKNPKFLHSGKTPKETYEKMWNLLSKGRPWRGEFINKSKDGTEYVEFSLISPIKQDNKDISHYVAINEDITEKKRLGRELDLYRHHLEELVRKRTSELEKAKKHAESVNQAKTNFLANMSHEIRTPMNAIIGFTYILQHNKATPEQLKHLNQISSASEHLLSLINDILDLSKIEDGKMTLEQSNFHLSSIYNYVLSLVSESAHTKGLTFKVEKNNVPQWLRGDSTRLKQALLNYVNNAVKFTKQGVITLRIKLLEDNEDSILLYFEVEDTGIGIEPDTIHRLFNSFEQADTSITRKYGGTGLGLTITRQLAQLMGGDTGVTSKPGYGSIFWFTARLCHGLGPVEEPLSTDLALVKDSTLYSRQSSGRILLVEENDVNLEVAQYLLKSSTIIIDTAKNGREAIAKVNNTRYDLILMDVQMPVMDGLEATRRIRAMDDKKDIPILAMTANVFEKDRQACFKAGMNDFIPKPVDAKDIFSKLNKWLPEDVTIESDNSTSREIVIPSEPPPVVKNILQHESPINMQTLYDLFANNTEKQHAMLKKFLINANDCISKISSAFDTRDMQQLSSWTHKLKSSTSLIGADELTNLCQVLEVGARKNNWTEIDSVYPDLLVAIEKVRAYIDKL